MCLGVIDLCFFVLYDDEIGSVVVFGLLCLVEFVQDIVCLIDCGCEDVNCMVVCFFLLCYVWVMDYIMMVDGQFIIICGVVFILNSMYGNNVLSMENILQCGSDCCVDSVVFGEVNVGCGGMCVFFGLGGNDCSGGKVFLLFGGIG